MLKNKRGVSLISLVITIILIIILASITYFASVSAISKTNYTRYVNNVKNVEDAIEERLVKVRGETIPKGKLYTNGQIYNYIADGGSSELDFVKKGEVPEYTIIKDNANFDFELPELKVNTPRDTGVNLVYAVTNDGTVFTWPPYSYKNGHYINQDSTVDIDIMYDSGDHDVTIGDKLKTITVDANGNLLDASMGGNQSSDNKTKLQKPTVTGTYTYNGQEQTAVLSGFDEATMTIVNNKRKNAGAGSVVVMLKDPENYAWAGGGGKNINIPWNIEKKKVSIEWSSTVFEYDGKTHVPSAKVVGVAGEQIKLKITGAAMAGGEYTANASIESVTNGKPDNYELENTSTKFEIRVKEILIKSADYYGRYDGNEKTFELTVKNLVSGYSIYYSIDTPLTASNCETAGTVVKPTRTNAGETVVYYYIKTIYGVEKAGSNKITIEKIEIYPTLNMENYVYGGIKPTPSVNGNIENAPVTYYVTTSNLTTGGKNWAEVTDATGLDVGKYYMYAVVSTSTNYKSATTPTKAFTVTNGNMTGSVSIVGNAVYGQTLTANSTAIIPTGCTLQYAWWSATSASATTGATIADSTNSATYKVGKGLIGKYIGVTVTATKANYNEKVFTDITDSSNGGNGTIVTKDASVLAVTLNQTQFEYIGTEIKPTITIKDDGSTLVNGTDYDITYTNNVNAGIATITIIYKGNYTGKVEKTFEIAKKAMIVLPTSGQSKIYGSSDPVLAYTSSGMISGQTPAFNGVLSRTTGENVGTYAINKGTLALKDNGAFLANNYNLVLSGTAVNFAINAKSSSTLAASLDTTSYTYDGSAKIPTATIKDDSKTLTSGTDYTLSYVNNVNAGKATATITFKGNYIGAIEKTFTIAKANISPSINMNGYSYGGTKSAPTVSGNAGNGTVTYYYNTTNSNTNGANWKNVTGSAMLNAGTYYMYAVVNPTSNYNGATTAVKSFTISPKNISLTWGSTIVFTYNGRGQKPTVSATSGVSTETIKLTEIAPKIDAGSYTASVSIASVTGGNANKNNYKVTNPTKAYTINKKAISVAWSSTSFIWDGASHVPSASIATGVQLETMTLSVSGVTTKSGTWTATASVQSLVGGQGKTSNYNVGNTTTKFTVNKLIAVGHYINYTPTSSSMWTSSNNTGATSVQLSTNTSVKWRVLSIDDNTGNVVVTTNGHVNRMSLQGTAGFLRGANELNRICAKLYSNSSKGITARSMTIEDLNKACGYTPSTNLVRYAWYPSNTSNSNLKDVVAGGHTYKAVAHTSNLTGISCPRFFVWDDRNGVTHVSTGESNYVELKSQSSPVLTTSKMVWYSPVSLNSTVGDIIKGKENDRTWLASPICCLYTSGEQRAYFVMLTAYATAIHENYLMSSKGYSSGGEQGISPVITLNIKNIRFTESGKNGSTSSTAWNLK